MGAPEINIAFYERAAAAIQKGDKGVVALILVDTSVTDPTVYTTLDPSEVPSTLSTANKKYAALAWMGYINPPKKVYLAVVKLAANYDDALDAIEGLDWDWLAYPTVATDENTAAVATWIKNKRANNHRIFKAVLPSSASDSEGIVNVPEGYTDADGAVSAEAACARAAGIIAGTPWTMSSTYAPVTDAISCTEHTKAELDTAVNAGKFQFMWDGEKVKVCRGVTSLVTTSASKGDSYKKIRLVEIMDRISQDIRTTAEDSYIGKYTNTYDNKCLLVTAINGYFDTLVRDSLLSSGHCEIDVAANRTYIRSHGGTFVLDGETINLEDATEEQIRKAPTGSWVYLRATVGLLDAIEDIQLDIYIG